MLRRYQVNCPKFFRYITGWKKNNVSYLIKMMRVTYNTDIYDIRYSCVYRVA